MVNHSGWEEAMGRLIPETWPEYIPSFKIGRSDKIFTIGSCFARNIEEHLHALGYNVPMMAFSVPSGEWPNRPSGILNKYSPASIFQHLKWTEEIFLEGGKVSPRHLEKLLYACDDGSVIDMQKGGYVPLSRKDALERRQAIYDVFSHAFSSQVVIITLGLIEEWLDETTGLFIQRVPTGELLNSLDRFTFVRLHFSECLDYTQKSIDLLRNYSPGCRFLITTSPVPLKQTFTKDDVIVANMYSKSVLRAVCGEIVEKNILVDYFPSYENVVLTQEWGIYEEDMRHISGDFVKKIVKNLVDHYL